MAGKHTYTPSFYRITGTVGGASALTRPADTTAYAAGDEISNSTSAGSAAPFVFALAARGKGDGGLIRSIICEVSDITSPPDLWIALYGDTPTMVGDNAVWAQKAADFGKFIGHFSLAASGFIGAGDDVARRIWPNQSAVDAQQFAAYTCAGTSLYGVLLSDGIYTPDSAGTFKVSMIVERY